MTFLSPHWIGWLAVFGAVAQLAAAHYLPNFPPEAAWLVLPCALAFLALGCLRWSVYSKYLALMWLSLAVELSFWFIVGIKLVGLQRYYQEWIFYEREVGLYFTLATFWTGAFSLGGLFRLFHRKVWRSRGVSGQ
jgi:hypothetical protein